MADEKQRIRQRTPHYRQKAKEWAERNKEKMDLWHENNKGKLKQYQKRYYDKNFKSTKPRSTKTKDMLRERHLRFLEKRKQIQKDREFIKNYKNDKCCVICGYNDCPGILEYHHKNPKEKERNVCVYRTKTRFLKELSKCVLLCPNCHSIEHLKNIFQNN